MKEEKKIPIICIHGIRRQDKWYEILQENLDNDKYEIKVFQDEFWTIFRLIVPFMRKKKIKEFQSFYNQIRTEYKILPYLVCHSFGSYILFQSLKKYDVLRFDKVLMVGSILDPSLVWDKYFKGSSPQIKKMFHEHGLKDKFVWMTRFIEDGGNSGEIGFLNIEKSTRVGKYLIQKKYSNFDHSDYFLPLHIQENWVPFITGEELPYNPKVLREDIIPRLYENIENLQENMKNFDLNQIEYRARIDKNGNYYLKYNFQGRIKQNNIDYFVFKTSADSVRDFQKSDILATNDNAYPLEVSIENIEAFKALIKIDCDTDKQIHETFNLNISLCWSEVMSFDKGDTDHFALKNIDFGIIRLNFPCKIKNPTFFYILDEEITKIKRASMDEELDGSFTYYLEVDNKEENIDGIVFYYDGQYKQNTNSKKLILDTSIEKLRLEDETEILFKFCTIKDIENVYFLEKNHIEFDNSAKEACLQKRLELFPYGFLVAYHNNTLIGYVESIIINDWKFKTFNEIKNFENHYNIDGNTLYVIFIAVHPNYRIQGIASKFLEILEKQVVSRFNNINKIKLISKDEAIKLYKNNDFIVKTNLPNFLPASPINGVMTKDVNRRN